MKLCRLPASVTVKNILSQLANRNKNKISSQKSPGIYLLNTMASKTNVQEVQEGQAKVVLPESVFYNPVQEYNRDLTIAVISEYTQETFDKRCSGDEGSKKVKDASENGNLSEFGNLVSGKKYDNGVRIFEGLAASGLRSVRFGLEIPGINEVVANDYDTKAVEFIKKNIEKNNLDDIMKAKHGDAAMGMYENRSPELQFHVIDLDPYGSPSMFLDAAVQAVKDGGLLCITCTDAAVLCGNAPEKCNANYGAVSLRSKFCHEMALRIILQCLDSHANRYSRYIVPLLSLSIDFYFRVFVKVHTSQRQVKHSAAKRGMVFECVGCGTYALQPSAVAIPTKGEGNFKFLPGSGPVVPQKCQHCGHGHRMGGPVWSAPLHDREFVQRVIKRVEQKPKQFGTSSRIIGMLNVVMEELCDVPLYYVLDAVCSTLHCAPPSMKTLRSALLNAGYAISLSHASKNSYKTTAPPQVIWDIMRAWIKDHPVNAKRLEGGSVVKAILDKPVETDISFEDHPDSNPNSREKGLLRWQQNPEPYWGPKAKAKRTHNEDMAEKRATNQGKRQKGNQAEVGNEEKSEMQQKQESSDSTH